MFYLKRKEEGEAISIRESYCTLLRRTYPKPIGIFKTLPILFINSTRHTIETATSNLLETPNYFVEYTLSTDQQAGKIVDTKPIVCFPSI